MPNCRYYAVNYGPNTLFMLIFPYLGIIIGIIYAILRKYFENSGIFYVNYRQIIAVLGPRIGKLLAF